MKEFSTVDLAHTVSRMPYISDSLLEGIAFLGVQRAEVVVPGGTAFLIDVPANPERPEDGSVLYLATARHVLEESRAETLYILVNTDDGARFEFPTPRGDWATHDREDVAVWLIGPSDRLPIKGWKPEAIPIEFFLSDAHEFDTADATRATLRGERVALGDEILYIGLFRESAGRERNFPVARFGRVARMPGEPLTLKRWGGDRFEIDGFLVETISHGGFSGSPVIWRRQVTIPVTKNGIVAGFHQTYISGLMGLLSGHYDIRTRIRGWRADGENEAAPEVGLNSGMGIVTPVSAIRSLLNREDVAEERRRMAHAG